MGGLLGGLAVGTCDGFQAGIQAEIALTRLPASAALGATVTLMAGGLLSLLVVVANRLGRWGRRERYTRTTNLVAFGVTALATAAMTAVAVMATDERPRRFLAALVVALTAAVTGVVAAIIAPALARVFAPSVLRLRQNEATVVAQAPRATRATPAGLWVLAPLATVLLASLVFLVVWLTRASPRPGVQIFRVAFCAVVAGIIPPAIALVSLRMRRVPSLVAAGGAIALLLVPAAVFVRHTWTAHLQFLPWRDVRVVLATAIAGFCAALLLHRSEFGRRLAVRRGLARRLVLWTAMMGAMPAAGSAALHLARSDAPRKATMLHGGLVSPLVRSVRPAFDGDRDGYARALGGGDCNDGHPGINPGARDWPHDGVDQDCDGEDLSLEGLAPPPLAPLPKSVPQDLNVILIVVSGLRADHVGSYGYQRKTTPSLDRLASESVLFESGWAHAPTTRLSLPAILTGRWPSAIDWSCSTEWPTLSHTQRTVGEVLYQHGYVTAMFHADRDFARNHARGFDRGIQFYDDRRMTLHRPGLSPGGVTGSSARQVTDDVLDFLRMYGDGEWKLFVTVHLADPDPDHERHSEAPEFGRKTMDLYDSEVWFSDKQVGRIIAALKERGLYDKTAIVVTGDHGEVFGSRRVPRDADLSAAQTRVPVMMRIPGVASRRVDAPIGHVDIAPTIVNLVRADPDAGFLGRSLLWSLAPPTGEREQPSAVFQEGTFRAEEGDVHWSVIERHGIASASHHVIWQRVPGDTYACYDLRRDPGERRDVSAAQMAEDVCARLSRMLRRRVAQTPFLEQPPELAVELVASESSQTLPVPTPEFPSRARFGAAIDFVGHELTASRRAPAGVRLARCGQLEITLHFEVVKPLAGWELFLEVEGPHPSKGGGAVAQKPALKTVTFPGDRWLGKQRVRERFAIKAHPRQPTGLYTVYVGFGRPPGMSERLSFVVPDAPGESTRLPLLTIRVD